MQPRRRPLVAIAMIVGAAVAAAVVGRAQGLGDGSMEFSSFHAVAGVSFTGLGALIMAQRPGGVVGELFVLIGLCSLVVVVSASFALHPAASWIEQWTFALPFGLLPSVFLRFPEGRLPSAAWRPVELAALVGSGVAAVFLAWAAIEAPRLFLVPTDVPAAVQPLLWAAAAGLLVVVLTNVVAVVSLLGRWRRAGGDVRQQLRVLALGAAVVPVGLVVDFFLGVEWLWYGLAVAVPAAASAAILRYRLYDIDLVLNRTLVYGTLTTLVVTGYSVLVTLVAPVLGTGAAAGESLVAAAVALAALPLRHRIQHGVDRLLFGDRADPYAVVTRLSRQLQQAADLSTVLPRTAATVADALRLPYVGVELGSGDHASVVADHGRSGIAPEGFPMTYRGRQVGRLLVSPRSASDPFSSVERDLLTSLAAQAGVAAHAVRLTTDLQRSRERLVRTREEERRRLRRELHDGLGPALAGMTMQVGAARSLLLQHETDGVAETLHSLEQHLRSSVADIRHIVDDLRPAVLDRLGLVGAVRHHAGTFTTGPDRIRIEVTADQLGELPAAVEVAAYRIALEAMSNTVRHADARRCTVQFAVDPALVLDVADDGIGLPADPPPGVGLVSMRERAEELGGEFHARRGIDGGTRVRAVLPMGVR